MGVGRLICILLNNHNTKDTTYGDGKVFRENLSKYSEYVQLTI